MTNPNPSIQEQIKAESRKRWYYDNADDIIKRGIFIEGAAFASTLYASRIQELEKENERLTLLLMDAVAGGEKGYHNVYKWDNYSKDNNIQPIK